MGTLGRLFKFNGTAWSLGAGLLLPVLLAGCTPLVNVEVNVDTCQAGGPRTPLPPPGACNNGGTGPIVVSNTICKNCGQDPQSPVSQVLHVVQGINVWMAILAPRTVKLARQYGRKRVETTARVFALPITKSLRMGGDSHLGGFDKSR